MNEISIIVPIYNVAEYLEECIQSILVQRMNSIEIILVDDGSTDGCAELCDFYAEKDRRIIVIHKENGGLVSARKEGLKRATGKYIAYVDGDDWIEPNMFEKMYHILLEENVDIIMCGRYENSVIWERQVFHGIPAGKYDKKRMISDVYPRMIVNETFFEWGVFPGVWDKLFRRECLEKYQMSVDNRISMGEDAACTYPCILNANSIFILHECLYHYRQSEFSMVRKKSDDIKSVRNSYKILFHSVLEQFENEKHIFDLREQWLKYILFLMIPRADELYEGIERLDFLFPFPKIKRDSSIVIYGAGIWGQRLYGYLKYTNFCKIAALADKNYLELQKNGINVIAPEDIDKYKHDAIVITASFENIRKTIFDDLCSRYPEDQICLMDEKLIWSDETLKAFGLM
jgi:glycosyltransferase involved in cell wall biosynthesis